MAASTIQKRRLGLQTILVWTLVVLLIVNRHILISYHHQSSSSFSSSNSHIILLIQSAGFLSTAPPTSSSVAAATSNADAASFKFYILVVPNMTTALLTRYSDSGGNGKDNTAAAAEAAAVYARFFNEDRAEMWLHRGLSHFTYEQGQTMDPNEADVFFIPGYLHYWKSRRSVFNKNESAIQQQQQQQTLTEQVFSVIVNKTKPHVLLIPTRDPTMNRLIGLKGLVQGLQKHGVNLYSVGFERNSLWQTVHTDRIIPIPYVVEPPSPLNHHHSNSNDNSNSNNDLSTIMFQHNRTENFVFLSVHPRPHAVSWSGCNRSMISPLIERRDENDNMDIRFGGGGGGGGGIGHGRMTQTLYNQRMQTSDYCLILCGDTPTSRSLASAMMAGCIPLRVGSWWRGLCEPPCKLKYGWTIANQPHFPYAQDIDWSLFPELNEAKFANNPLQTLHDFFNTTLQQEKQRARAEMKRVQKSWIYGWGNPVTSMQFGELYSYFWKSTLYEVGLCRETKK